MNKKSIAGIVGLVAALAFASSAAAATFSTSLKMGSTGEAVKALQMVLNSDSATVVATTGAGSPGNESMYYGALTKAAVIKFQAKYGIPQLGIVGPMTNAKLTAISGSVVTTTPGCTQLFDPITGKPCSGTVVTPTGAGVAVSAPAQPANGLAIQGSSRVPFTKITITAGSSDAVVNGITVERSGYAVNNNFAGVVLLDEDGTQLDIAKTLGSTNQAVIGGTFTVKAGMSKTLTVAGNMNSSLGANAGQVAGLTVVAVNAASVTGSLPITGAMHTINGTLTIGTATAANSSFDPGSAQNKEIGTTGYKFTGLRLTAGSAEDVRLKSIRFYQAGSVGSSDLANVMIYVDGTAYPTTVSTDGKYYSANFGSGIVLAKGLSKDIYIAGDIVGTGSANRSVRFDLQKNTDLYVVGETYGQGIIATGTVNSTALTSTPATVGYTVTINAGSFTGVTKATSVAAQNIAINLPSQVLGGYETDIKGESISVQSQVFHFATSSASIGSSMITSISLYDENGAVVAGPVDAVADGVSGQKVTFTDTVTYKVGKHVYTLKGKIPTGASNGAVITASTDIDTDWTNVTGQTTGNTISLGTTSSFNMNQVTVKAAALAISMSTSPVAQNIVAGGAGVTFANIQFDASASGEDVRFTSVSLSKSAFSGLSGCQLFDGSTALNSGSNVFNPASTGAETLSFDSTFNVAKNTVKTLALKCTVSSSATGGFAFTVASVPTVTGVTSGSSVTATLGSATSATQTVASGSLVASLSPSSPSYALTAAGSTGVTAGVIRFRATNEGVNLSRIGLVLTSGSASDLVQVSIWDGSTQVGTATFTGGSTVATSTLSQVVALPKDADKDLTVKVDLAQVGSGQSGTQGSLIKVDNNASTDVGGTQGTGTGSGVSINASGSTAVAGVRLFKSFPTFAKDSMTSAGVADGELMKFKVTANANGGLGLNQFKFTIATSTVTGVTLVNLYGYTDATYSTLIPGFSGQIATSNVAPGTSGAVTITPSAVINVPAGATYYFKLTGTVAGVTTGSSVTTTLLGDAASVAVSTSASIAGANNLIWSGNATTTSAAAHVDWVNGYGVVGLPSSGLIQTRNN